MEPVKKVKKTADRRVTQKTKADFLRWLSVRDALKKKAAEDAADAPGPPSQPKKL